MDEPLPSVPLPIRPDAGGDAACWLRRVCPECGRLHGEDPPDVCEVCGADLPG